VTDASRDPVLDSICHLHIKRKFLLFSAGEYTGTGVLCKGRYILTAGHNVYQDRSSIASISIRCGTAEPMTVAATEIIDGRQGRDASNYPHGGFARDFGVIRLARPIAARASFSLAASAPAIGTTLYFAGYPDEGDPVHAPLRDGWHLHRAKDVAMANDEATRTISARSGRTAAGRYGLKPGDNQCSSRSMSARAGDGWLIRTSSTRLTG